MKTRPRRDVALFKKTVYVLVRIVFDMANAGQSHQNPHKSLKWRIGLGKCQVDIGSVSN